MKILCFTINNPQGHEGYESYFNEKVFNIDDDFNLDNFIEKIVKKTLKKNNFHNDSIVEIWEDGKLIKIVKIDIEYEIFETKFKITKENAGD